MALWGVSDSDESKPKYLNTADAKNCIAKPEGWVLKKTVGSRNLEEILVTRLSILLKTPIIVGPRGDESCN